MLPILVFTVDTKIVFIFLDPYLCYPDMLLFPHFATDKIQFRQFKWGSFEEADGVGAQCLTAFSVLDSHSSNVSLSLFGFGCIVPGSSLPVTLKVKFTF